MNLDDLGQVAVSDFGGGRLFSVVGAARPKKIRKWKMKHGTLEEKIQLGNHHV